MRRSLIGTLGLYCLAGWLAGWAWAQDKPAPKIVISPESWDFGEVWHGEEPKVTLTIKNEGNADLKITRFKAC